MNTTTKHPQIAIIEDELHNSRMLKDIIEKLRPQWNIIAILESIEESIEWFNQNNAPTLILMDIQLSDGLSFTIFEHVEINKASKIIFTTAYDEYAIRAFKVNSIDYLLKPIEENDLELAFQKFEQLTELNSNQNKTDSNEAENYKKILQQILQGKKQYKKRFLISGINSFQKIETKDIAYIYSDHKMTFAVDYHKKEHLLDYNMEQLESELDPNDFFRANRKTIININAIEKVNNETGNKLRVISSPSPNFEIIVSRLKATDFKIWLGK